MCAMSLGDTLKIGVGRMCPLVLGKWLVRGELCNNSVWILWVSEPVLCRCLHIVPVLKPKGLPRTLSQFFWQKTHLDHELQKHTFFVIIIIIYNTQQTLFSKQYLGSNHWTITVLAIWLEPFSYHVSFSPLSHADTMILCLHPSACHAPPADAGNCCRSPGVPADPHWSEINFKKIYSPRLFPQYLYHPISRRWHPYLGKI